MMPDRSHLAPAAAPAARIPLAALAALAALALAACAPRQGANADSAATDTGAASAARAADSARPGLAAQAAAAGAIFSSAGADATGFRTPESARWDADLDVWFVSNIVGNPSAKDGNGVISRIDAANTGAAPATLVEGGRNGATLHAPKGLAIVGDTLWVADIDAVRGFHKRTGAPVATIDLAARGAVFLNDVAAGGDGALYVTDTGIRFSEAGEMSHPGPDRVFRIAGRAATVALEGSTLAAPNGIAWDARGSRFIIVSFDGPALLAWTPGAAQPTPLATGPGGHDGVEVLADGRILVTSWADSAVHVLENGRLRRVVTGIDGPADIGIDTKRGVLAVPGFTGNVVKWYGVR